MTLVEYGLLVALLVLAVMVGFGRASEEIAFLWGDNSSRLAEALNENRGE